MNFNSEKLIDGLFFPEGPRWYENKLWFSDMYAGRVLNVDLDGRVENVIESKGWLSGLGWLPDGQLLVVSMLDRCLLKLVKGQLVEVANLNELATFHCNDMVVDNNGRAYIGNFGFDVLANKAFEAAEIIMVNPDGQAHIVATDMAFPNGSVITPDGDTLIVAESLNDCLTAFDIKPDGMLEHRRRWATLAGLGPDGICLDEEGAIWVASPLLREVIRIREGGEVTHRYTPDLCPYACMLGGADRRTLFVCEAAPLDQIMHVSDSGCIEYFEVDIPGAGLP